MKTNMATCLEFHEHCGRGIVLSNRGRRATRNHADSEFDNGLVFSKGILPEITIFEVVIERKTTIWSGSLAMGVTINDPSSLDEIPVSVSHLKNGTWVLTGTNILKDGLSCREDYGDNLEDLAVGDKVGVMKLRNGELHFFINGKDMGCAAQGIPENVFVVVDVYGRCSQVKLCHGDSLKDDTLHRYENAYSMEGIPLAVTPFHNCHSSLVKLSNNDFTAERLQPLSEFKNAVVLTREPLPPDKLFEVRLDQQIRRWRGNLEIGVTTLTPERSEHPITITDVTSGTWIISGSSIITNGKVLKNDVVKPNLESLKVGDRIGVMVKKDQTLKLFINGDDKGVVAYEVPSPVHGVIDLYGNTCSVTITASKGLTSSSDQYENISSSRVVSHGLCFHPICGSRVKLSNDRKTVYRPNPNEDFNDGVALSERPLANEELLEVQIQEINDKWAGSLEIGVTTHEPGSFQLPATMTNISSGTWMLSGGAMVHNGITVLEAYGRDLASFKVGDKFGVCVKSDKTLHFYHNGVDLGLAASDLPSPLYAVVDLYGQSVQATILDSIPANETLQRTSQVTNTRIPQPVARGTENQEAPCNKDQPKFSEIHGRLIALNEDRTGASRLNALTEFNHAVVISDHPLEDESLFEIEIEKTTDRWSGSIEVGLLSFAPPDLELPITLTDLNHHAWVLSGASVMQDGNTIVNGYGVDLDSVGVGTRIGVMRKSDGTFHVFVNGEDKGTAATFVPPGVFAAVDLYGQCVQVAIVTSDRTPADFSVTRTPSAESLIDKSMLDLLYSFHSCGGENIAFRNHSHTAVRIRSFNGGLVFSNKPLQDEIIFEIRVDKVEQKWTGSLCIGVTSTHLPLTQVPPQISDLRNSTIFLAGSFIFKDGVKVRGHGVSLDRLQEGSRVGIQRHYDGSMHIYIDSKHKGIVATNIPAGVYGVVDVYGSTQSVSIVNTTNRSKYETFLDGSSSVLSARDISSDEELVTNQPQKPESTIPELSFHSKCGLNVIMDASCTTARRKATYNEGLVFSRKPLANKEMFQVRFDSLNPSWSGSLAVGVIGVHSLEKLNLSATAVSLRLNSCAFVHGSQIYINGVKTELNYDCNFDDLREGDRVGVMCDGESRVHIIVNDVDQGFIDHEIPGPRYAILDLYGRCEQVSVVPSNKVPELRINHGLPEAREKEGTGNDEKQDMKESQETKPELSKDQDLSCQNCEYRKCCQRFQVTLGIPEPYFTKTVTCYCSSCCAVRGESSVAVSGDPPQEYSRPTGWCKFELRLPPNVNSAQIFRRSHVAYIGVHVGAIRRTLDRGTVLPPRKSNRAINGDGDHKILTSPCIDRAITLSGEKNFLFTDTTSGKRWSTHVAFELRLSGDSYTMSPNSKTELDSRDWCVELPANIVLTGLLVQISEEDR